MPLHITVVVSDELCQLTVALPLSGVNFHNRQVLIGSLRMRSQYLFAEIPAVASDDVC